jgi:integrase
MLRHSYAWAELESGTNIKKLQLNMGHADIRVTLNTYGHWLKEVPSE